MAYTYEFGKWLTNPPPGEEVVISGISGRLPESNNIREFKDNLFAKRDMITDDGRRWSLDHPEVPKRNGKIYNIDKLDSGFFGLHYRQAEIMDPMTRKFLECAIEAIYDAGLNPKELEGSKTAVCVGACYADMEIETLSNITEPQSLGITGYLRSFIAHRVSYFLKLKGISCILDSACSSSMNALEQAFKAIRTGKCDNALVGGVNLLLHPGLTRQFYRLGVLSNDGTCKVFDQKADGYVRGETICCILLQKAKNARRIYGQVIYSKINSDGFKPSGITFPSTEMQKQLMSEIFIDSNVSPSDLSFMEAHGTGTQVGDPQEVDAIDGAIAKHRKEVLLIGSVKCSVGHTEPASGLCSLAKVIVAMETGYIPPNIHLNEIKKGMLGFEQGRMKVVTEATKLEKNDAILGINNFGFGGNNGHLLIRRFNKVKKNRGLPEDELPRLVCISGRCQKAVETFINDLNSEPFDYEHIALIHQIFKTKIEEHCYRGFTILTKNGATKSSVKFSTNKKPLRLVFGPLQKDYKLIGKYLMGFSAFKNTMKKINDTFGREIVNQFGFDSEFDTFGSFIVQIGIVELFKTLGIEPEAVYGESIGKIAAAFYYDDISLNEALEVVFNKSVDSNINFEAKLGKTSQKLKKINNFDGINVKANNNNNNIRSEASTVKPSQNYITLNISDSTIENNSLVFCKNNKVQFLEILGMLYEEGHDIHLDKLYPFVEFPVSRGTPMIAPSIQWDYTKSWKTFKFGECTGSDVTQGEHNLSSTLYEEQKYMTGHVIDGRNLIPATEYLRLVRATFIQKFRMTEIDNLPVIFENCKFIKAITLPKTGAVKLFVTIQKGTGNFEISEKNSVVVSGRIYSPNNENLEEIEIPTSDIPEEKTEFLETDEIYRELYLRGYNYSGLFKGIVKSNVDGTAALIKWENNWTAFLDKMLQLRILQMDTRSLYVPVAIKKLSMIPLKHMHYVEKHNSLCPVYVNKTSNIIKSGGVEIHGIQATAILKKKSTTVPVLEKNVFIPNQTEISLEQSARVITQIILENSLENNFKAVEIHDDFADEKYDLFSPLLGKALNDVPSVIVNLIISSKNPIETDAEIKVENYVFTSSSNLLLITAAQIFSRGNVLNQLITALSPNGFLLTREKLDFIPENLDSLEIVSEHITEKEKIILFKKVKESTIGEIIEITSSHFNWIPKLQEAMKNNSKIVVYSQKSEPEGILGFVNCLRREPGGNKISCFVIFDENAPLFDINNSLYKSQLRKGLAMNVYKEKKWGTYRHLLLDEIKEVEGNHFYVSNTVRGDLTSLKWIQGPLHPKIEVEGKDIIVYPYYSALNFKDIMIATGRVSIDNFTTDRIDQECCLGFEFAGVDAKGRRLMGMTKRAALANIVVADSTFIWEIPEYLTMEDAATIVVVYATVLYGLFNVTKLKPGNSILIHSATGGVGLAAINICLYYKCDIYVTVGTKEKREYLRKHYPQIPESHIGNSHDLSFEEMIKTETKGRGVDFVLNSLSEEKLKASIRCVAPGGNFLEIGKFDLGNDAALNLYFLERNVNYHGVMLDRVFAKVCDQRKWISDIMNEGFEKQFIKPLPRTVFKKNEVIDAYKYMTTGKHIGKVLIKVREENKDLINAKFTGTPRYFCNPSSSYIIIGGLGGVGLELADWCYLRGAKKIILVSSRGIQSGYQKQRIKIWRNAGVTVQISCRDITTKQGCIELIKEAKKLGPVDAIFNLAVVLKDALFEDQTKDSFSISLAPKAKATIYLDEITRTACPQLKHFVVFSSVSCGRGNAGQTNYGMANSIMERICEKRKSDGLPGLAIQWGAIGDVGLVAKMQKENKELVIGGTLQQKISSCLEVLDVFLNQDSPIVSSMVVAEKTNKSAAGSAVDVVAYILGIKDVKSVFNTSFAELGMDSMMGTEMIQILEKDFEIYITAKEVRNLTFAKLMELEVQHQTQNQGVNKVEKGADILLKYIPRESTSNLPLVELSNHDDKNLKTVFVFPGVEGVFEGMDKLRKNVKANLVGIEYSYCYQENTIEGYAQKILPFIEEKIGKDKSFVLIAYSFGTAVATECVKLLENKGYSGKYIAIEGSPGYLAAATRINFNVEDQNEFQTKLVFIILSNILPIEQLLQKKDKYLSCKNLEERIEMAIADIPVEVIKEKDIQKKAVFAVYNRFKAVINYNFKDPKIKSPICLFKAKYPLVEDIANDYKFGEICEQPVHVSVIDSNHTAILELEQLIDDINKIIHD